MPSVVASGPNFNATHSDTVLACHGTIAEQQDEAHYDDRSDASDDFDKGRIRFPRGKLYGRDAELKRLREVYQCVSASDEDEDTHLKRVSEVSEKSETSGNNEAPPPLSPCPSTTKTTARVVFLSGLSGTGKSALVDECVEQVSSSSINPEKWPLFGSGKFEQYGEASPFSAISDSLAMYTHDLLERSNDEEELRKVRKALKKCGLGPTDEDSAVLIDTFPPLAPLLRGTSSSSTQEDAAEEKSDKGQASGLDITRLRNVFANLVMALGKKQDRPIIMFIDDLQWADEASLDIITALLLNKSLKHFLFVGSYRSNEVSGDDHPFGKRMVEIESGLEDGAVEKMEISGLLPKDIASFVSDSTQREIEDAQPIVELVYKKTLGNIFFVMQALEELVRRNILYYDIICYEWQWNLDHAELHNFVSVDVVDMIKSKIGGLSEECQRTMVMVAYTQNTISAHTVLALMQADGHTLELAHALKLLNEAAGEGLLLKTLNPNEYTFAHDLIQEAAYSSVAEGEEKDRLLVQIAKVLVDRHALDGEEWMLFVAANHFNSVPRKHIDSSENLAALNLRVANLATAKASLPQAVEFLRSGETYLDADSRWQKFYEISLNIFNRLIDTEFLLGNYERAEDAIKEVLTNAVSLRDKSTAHLNLVNIAVLKNNRNYTAGVLKGLNLLREYDELIPFSPTKFNLFWERIRLKRIRGNRPLHSLLKMPHLDGDSVGLMKLLELTLKYEYMGSVSPDLSTMIMNRALCVSFSQGICWELAILALSYAVAANKKDKPKKANLYSSLAANLQKEFPEAMTGGEYVKFQFRLLSVSKVRHPFQEDIGRFLELHQKALSNGLVDIGMASGLIYANCYFAAGLPINALLGSKLYLYEQRSVQMNQDSFCLMFRLCRQFVLNLMGKSGGNPTILKGVAFDEDETLCKLEGNSKKMALRDVSTFRLQLAYIFGDQATMGDMLERLKEFPLADLSVARGFLRVTFIGLAAGLLGRKQKKKEYLKLGRRVMKRYKRLVRAGGAANALPPYLCVQAVMKPTRKAYDKAIKACSDACMIQLEAMMCERCGELMKELKDEDNMKEYFAKALFLYSDWGAFAKVDQLNDQYDFMSCSTLKRRAPTSIGSSSKADWDS